MRAAHFKSREESKQHYQEGTKYTTLRVGSSNSICFQTRAKYLLQFRCYNFYLFFPKIRKDRENSSPVPSTKTNVVRHAYNCIKIRSRIGPTRVSRSEVLCEIVIVEFSFRLPTAQCICTAWNTSTAVKYRNASCWESVGPQVSCLF